MSLGPFLLRSKANRFAIMSTEHSQNATLPWESVRAPERKANVRVFGSVLTAAQREMSKNTD